MSTPTQSRSSASPAAVAAALGVVSAEQLLQQLGWRYAVKKFDPARRIPDGPWRALEQALVLTPSSYGLQPWKFIVVQERALRERLRPASWNQTQITDSSHLVVFCARRGMSAADVERWTARIAEVRGVPPASLDAYKAAMLGFVGKPRPGHELDAWCARQLYIALGVFLTSAALLGIDACPMEGIDPAQYDAILGLKDSGYGALCVATAGYRATDDDYASQRKARYAEDAVIERR